MGAYLMESGEYLLDSRMYSLDTSFLNAENLISSLTMTNQGDILPSNIFAAPVTIQLKFLCAFCENSFELPNVVAKSREMRQMESLALEHFKKRVLRVAEESLMDASLVFPEDNDGERYKKLLSSLTLCHGCIFHFAKAEEMILKDQLKYLEKVTGVRKMEEIFTDPWLELKKLVFHKFRGQEVAIKEKLELIEKMFASEENPLNSHLNDNEKTSHSTEQMASTSTAVPTTVPVSASTSVHPILFSTPVTLSSPVTAGHGVITMDVSDILGKPSDDECCPPSTSSNFLEGPKKISNEGGGESSRISSCGASPKQARDMPNEGGASTRETDDDDMRMDMDMSSKPAPPPPVPQVQNNKQDEVQDIVKDIDQESKASCTSASGSKSSGAVPEGMKTPNKKATQDDNKDKGKESECESEASVRSVRRSKRSVIPPAHQSPVVRIKPLSPSKTPSHSPAPSRAGSVSKIKIPTSATTSAVKNLAVTVEQLMDDLIDDKNDKTSLENPSTQETVTDKEESDSKNSKKAKTENEQSKNKDIQSDLEDILAQEDSDSEVVKEPPASKANSLNKKNVQGSKDTDNESEIGAKNKKTKASTSKPSEEEWLESSPKLNDDSDQSDGPNSTNSDSTSTYVETNRKKKGKRKRKSLNDEGNKNKRSKVKFPLKGAKQTKLSCEDELILKSPTKSSEDKNKPKAGFKNPNSKITPSFSKADKKSNGNFFASPLLPKKNRKSSENSRASSSDTEKFRRKSGNMSQDKLQGGNRASVSNESQQKKEATPTETEKPKKVFLIGNRYLTEPSSSDDDDSDFEVNAAPVGNSDSD